MRTQVFTVMHGHRGPICTAQAYRVHILLRGKLFPWGESFVKIFGVSAGRLGTKTSPNKRTKIPLRHITGYIHTMEVTVCI